MSQFILDVDPSKCTGCRICMNICSFHHYRSFNPSKAMITVVRQSEEMDVPLVCVHCQQAICEAVCGSRAISRERKTGAVLVDGNLCIECRLCMIVCPFDAIRLDQKSNVVRCDLCGGEAKCAKWCPTGAIRHGKFDRSKLSKGMFGVELYDLVITHCKDLVSSMIKNGSTVPLTDLTTKRRRSLLLSTLKIDREDIKKLAKATKLLQTLEER